MGNNQDIHYENYVSYINELHEKNKRRIRSSGIIIVLLPVILGLVRWLTDSDKTVFLLIWILCMFLLAAYLVSVEYLDHVLCRRLKAITDGEEDLTGLLEIERAVPSRIRERVRKRLTADEADAYDSTDEADAPDTMDAYDSSDAPDAADDAEEGGRE